MMLYFLIEKEFKQFLRNSFLPRMVVMMPLMMMLVLPWAANQEVRHLALCVVDHDESAYTHRLTERIVATDYFHLACRASTYDEALERVKNGEADMVLEFPTHFERDSQRGEQPSAYVATNAVDGTKGTIGSSYLAQILASPLPDEKAAQAILSPLSQQFRFNPHLDYKVFMVPAMMVMLLTLLAGYLPALNIVGEKEKGTIEQMNVSPVSRLQFVMAKLLPFWAVGLFVMTLCLVLAAVVYGLVPQGSLGSIYVLAAVYILVVSGMGLVISNYSHTTQQAVLVMYFFTMILLLMSGLLTPLRSMPEWAQYIAAANPLRYFVEAMRAIFLKGSTLADLSRQVLALLSFAAVFNAWAVATYKKVE